MELKDLKRGKCQQYTENSYLSRENLKPGIFETLKLIFDYYWCVLDVDLLGCIHGKAMMEFCRGAMMQSCVNMLA